MLRAESYLIRSDFIHQLQYLTLFLIAISGKNITNNILSGIFIIHLYQVIFFFIISIAIKFQNGACVIPEASQEGALRSFKSYEDIVMFNYNVPKQVLRATWQFAAFMDDTDCPHRKVNM